MIVSTRGRYALRAMVDIAENGNGGYVPLREIAKRQDISEKYLEGILPAIAKAGLLDGLRGKGGGYKLSRPPKDYTVGSILSITEGGVEPVGCPNCGRGNKTKCDRANTCRTLPMWNKLYALIDEFFEGITIADLIEEDKIVT